jgi:hypothetical protein
MVLCGALSETYVTSAQLTQFWQIPRQNAFLFPVLTMFCHDCPLAVKPASSPWCQLPKQTWRDCLPIDLSFLLCLSWLLRCRV